MPSVRERWLLSTAFLVSASVGFGAERLTATGTVVDADGKAVDHAAVVVYSADVKNGFNLFCPTCYTDCGKRTFTDSGGSYRIAGLSPDLVFDFLVLRQAVTDKDGGFEIAYKPPLKAMMLQVAARGLAPKLVTEHTGADRKTIVLTEEATVRGRLLQNGKAISTKDDGQDVNLGDLLVKPSYTLEGKVVLSDGQAIPQGTRLSCSSRVMLVTR